MKRVVTWCGAPPEKCDVCGTAIEKVFIDGRTRQGPWGFLCPSCHALDGVGLGTGYGQRYELKNGKWEKTAG